MTSPSEWGDPGPDLGPGSGSSSSTGNRARSDGSGSYNGSDGKEIYGGGLDITEGNMKELQWAQEPDDKRQRDNVRHVSMASEASSKGGVGRAL